jgi:hypothetical protein
MVSSPWLRSPHSTSASLPVPENSSNAYHKEIYTVLFDPPSFLMVYSIVRHLWKLSKMTKFLPLHLIPIRKSQQESSCDSISEAEDEIQNSSTCVLESISANNHSFGTFHSVNVPIKLINAVQPQIEGCAIKIGEITCSLVSFNRSENLQFMNSTMKVQELEKKKPIVNLRISSALSALIKKQMEIFLEIDTLIQEPQKTVQEDRHVDFDIATTNQVVFSVNSFCNMGSANFVFVTSPKVFVANRRINDTVLVFEIVFDPSGDTGFLTVAKVLDDYVEILCREHQSHNDGETNHAIIVFDPGGKSDFCNFWYSSHFDAFCALRFPSFNIMLEVSIHCICLNI